MALPQSFWNGAHRQKSFLRSMSKDIKAIAKYSYYLRLRIKSTQ